MKFSLLFIFKLVFQALVDFALFWVSQNPVFTPRMFSLNGLKKDQVDFKNVENLEYLNYSIER